MFGNRAEYTWGCDGQILWLKDQGTDCRSLTNDIENCLIEIAGQLDKSLTDYRIIYRDSEKEWDGVVITSIGDKKGLETAIDWLKYNKERGRPYYSEFLQIDFFPVRELEYEKAKESILANERYKHIAK